MVAAETRIKPVTHNGMMTVGTCLTANCGFIMLYTGIQFTPQDIFCIERNKKGTEDEKEKEKRFFFLYCSNMFTGFLNYRSCLETSAVYMCGFQNCMFVLNFLNRTGSLKLKLSLKLIELRMHLFFIT